MQNEKKQKSYYVGLDIGTNSVGYAVTDESYHLIKFNGEPRWGAHVFEEANLANERRDHRSQRRRLDRRQQRVALVGELFAEEISKIDTNFFKRLQYSYVFPQDEDGKFRLFENMKDYKKYNRKYPTIHHLIVDLMENHQTIFFFFLLSYLSQ